LFGLEQPFQMILKDFELGLKQGRTVMNDGFGELGQNRLWNRSRTGSEKSDLFHDPTLPQIMISQNGRLSALRSLSGVDYTLPHA